MRRTRSYAKFLAFALAVSLALQSAPAMAAEEYAPIYGTVFDGNSSNMRPDIAIGKDSFAGVVDDTDNPTTVTGSALGAIAIGNEAIASNFLGNVIAIGYSAVSTGTNSTALGARTLASATGSSAFGYDAEATAIYSSALGVQAEAKNQYSVALGAYSVTTEDYSVSIGAGADFTGRDELKYRRLVNMAAGRADTDAVNVAQLNDTLGILGNNTTVSSTDGTITKNGFTYRTGNPTTVQDAFDAIGTDIDELDANAVKYAAGHANKLTLTDSGDLVRIGNVAAGTVDATSTYAVNGAQLYSLAESIADKLGVTYSGGTTIGDFSVDINGKNYTNVADAIGALAKGWDINGTAGTGGTVTGTGSGTVLPGGSLNVEAGDNIEISVGGTGGNADLNISVSDNPTFDSVTAGSMTADTITAGTITASDSVTVGTGDNQTVIDGNAGTVTVGTDGNQTVIGKGTGTFTNDNGTTSIDGQKGTFGSTGDQTVIDGGSLKVNTGNVAVIVNNTGLQVNNGNGNGDQVWIKNDGTVYTGKGNGKSSVTLTKNGTGKFTNDNGTTSIDGGNVEVSNQITVGGADGTVINNGSVSINNNSAYFRENAMKVGSMTYDGVSNTLNMGGAGRLTGLADGGVYMGSTDAVTGNQLWQAYKRMDQLQESINIVGAHAAALSGLHPIDYNPYEPTTLSAAIGTYRDEYAVAVGVFHYVRENVLFNLGASICSDGDLMGRAGISFTVGRGGDKKKALAPKDMNEVQAQLAEVRQALHELKAENAALKVRLDAKSK